MIHYFEQLTSSNDEATLPHYREGDIIWAERQSAGRGQRGHTWQSNEGENLTFTALLEPTFLPPSEQFSLLQVVALAMADMLSEYGIEAKIKWTNDIYVGDRKLVGILMEHKLQGAVIGRTIAGIGLNVNQTEFDPELPNPTSMRLIAGREFDRKEVLERIALHLKNRYEMLRRGEIKQLHLDYHQRLYRLGEEHTYALPDGTRFRGVIEGVEPQGALKITTPQGEAYKFLFKEVEFVLKN
ncbi:MAG: biotin--[Alistipes sp.]|nr:biotin--[acetyl-CoA-carboxylase] ligase [Alistipes sp.]